MSGLSGVGVFWAFLSFLSSLVSCVGFFMPYWITGQMTINNPGQSSHTVPVHFGIFRRCNYPIISDDRTLTMIHECGRYSTFNDIPSVSWKISALTIGFGCGLCVLVALTAMFGICVKGVVIATTARSAGIIQLCSGLIMSAGLGIYPNGWDSPEVSQACGFTSRAYALGTCSLSWCFYLTAAGVGLTLLSSILAWHAPKKKRLLTGHPL